ncbi:hypothetical protein ILUMI_08875, partial [Ignelater luminosus]
KEAMARQEITWCLGIVKMKTTARSYFWWPSKDKEIVSYVIGCDICMTCTPEPNKMINAMGKVETHSL